VGGTPPGLISGTAAEHVRLAFLFTGQGSQRPGMACDLYAAEPAFAAAFDEVAGHLDAELDRTLHEIVADGDLDQTVHTQPALFAVEVAQFRLAGHYGVRPDYLLGHSIGEIAAAHCAGVLSLPDACTLVAARGRLMQALPATGAMVAVEAAEDEVAPLLTAGLAVAAVNGPASVVVSGAAEEAEALADRLRADGRRVKRLAVSHAFHSPLMEPMIGEFRGVLTGLTFHPPRIPIVSDLTGAVAGAEISTPEHWAEHVQRTVRFHDGVLTLDSLGVGAYLELGPDGVLTGLAGAALSGPVTVVPALRRDRPEPTTFREALAALHVAGVAVDWEPALPARPEHVELPTYPFQRRRYWLQPHRAVAPAEVPVVEPAAEEPLVPIRPEDLVAALVAAVLGLDGPDAVDMEQGFLHLGFDSLTAVQLRNRLRAAYELDLPATLIFDHPTPADLARHVAGRIAEKEELQNAHT
jgi:acyl transferase domain-containing protein